MGNRDPTHNPSATRCIFPKRRFTNSRTIKIPNSQTTTGRSSGTSVFAGPFSALKNEKTIRYKNLGPLISQFAFKYFGLICFLPHFDQAYHFLCTSIKFRAVFVTSPTAFPFLNSFLSYGLGSFVTPLTLPFNGEELRISPSGSTHP